MVDEEPGTIVQFNAITGEHQIKLDVCGYCQLDLNDPDLVFVFEGSEAYLNSPHPSRALKDNPKYAEYFELLKTCRGVSVMAVKSKMKAAGLDPAILDKGPEALETNETVCRQDPKEMILRLADDVGIELTPECLRDFKKADNGGTDFKFTATDIAQLKPRVKFLNILDKAEGMALAGELDKESASADVATKRRLAHQSASKLRIAMGGMFPDFDVAKKLAEVRRKYIGFVTDVEVVKDAASKSFEELNVMRWNDKADKERIKLVMELARLVRSNGLLSMLEKFNLLERGLKGVERADEETRRVVDEIMKEPGGE